MSRNTGSVGSRRVLRRIPWASVVALSIAALLVASCCNPCCPIEDPNKPIHPGYPLKKVRFHNAGSKPVLPGMVTQMSADRFGNLGFMLHSNTWLQIDPGKTDMRSKSYSLPIRSYRLTFTIQGGSPITVVAKKPDEIKGTDDVGWCLVELQDYASGAHGCRLKFQFKFMRNGGPEQSTAEWYVVP